MTSVLWRRALRDLFLSLFDEESLRSFLIYDVDCRPLIDELPGGHAGFGLLVDRTISLLERYGLVGPILFQQLKQRRESRRREIDAVYELWREFFAEGQALIVKSNLPETLDFPARKRLTEDLAKAFPLASEAYRIAEDLRIDISPEAAQRKARLLWQEIVAEANRRHDGTLENLKQLSMTKGLRLMDSVKPADALRLNREVDERGHTYSDRKLVFISYSHLDSEWLERLLIHLKPLVRKNTILAWSDRDIRPGTHWMSEIEAALKAARVAILLVSANFLASDFIVEMELTTLLERAESEELSIFWVAVSPSLYRETEIFKYQAINDPARPLESLSRSDQEQALLKVAERIIELLSSGR